MRWAITIWIALWAATANAQQYDVWVGTTTPRGGESKGIYHARFDAEKGQLARPQLAAELGSPGFLALHPAGRVLYATGVVDGEPVVAAYAIQRAGGKTSLQRLNMQPIGDGGAAHLSTDRVGRALITAQYGGGSTALFPLAPDGALQPRAQLIKHEGGSQVVPGRQDAPHAHWVGTSPDDRYVFVPDLGLDKVVIYRLDADQPALEPHGVGVCPPGGGPRHMKFHPDGRTIYVLNELALTVTVFAYDAAAGSMRALETVPTVAASEKTKEKFVSAAEIRVHPSGKFVYASNRGHDTITVFRVDDQSGLLTLVECEPVRGSWPRNFNIDPTGRWLLAAGRDSQNIAVFAIDGESGELTYTLHMVAVPTPICITIGRDEE